MVKMSQTSRTLKIGIMLLQNVWNWLPIDGESYRTRTESSTTLPWKPHRLTYFIKALRHNRDDGNQCINSDSDYSEDDHTLNVNNKTVLLHKQPTYLSRNGQVYTVHPTCCDWDDCVLELTSQHRISCETTWWSLVNSGYWYLMGGPGPSSKATSINVAGTFSCKNRIKISYGY